VSLAAATLRPFDAALLIGVDADHLPAAAAETLFMSDAVCAELGLATIDAELRAQAAQLASLIATVPRVAATWRTRRGDEPNVLSPLLQRLAIVARRSIGDELVRPIVAPTFEVAPAPSSRPAPIVALLPDRISASEAQALIDCPYRFFARRLLRLSEPDDVIELPDKREFGEALHKVLQRFHAEWGGAAFDTLDADTLGASLRRHADLVFAPLIEQAPAMLAFARRFDGMAGGYVDWLRQHAAEGWRWTAGEVRRETLLLLPGGREIVLHGRIDRIDRDADGREMVIDYKARPTQALSRSLKIAGEDIQLPFYGLLAGGAAAASYLSFDRAGEGEGGVEPVAPKQPFGELVHDVGERLAADLQRITDGAPLPAIGAAAVCRYCEMRGLCRRDYWDEGEAGGGGAARP
jgi:ATP-dependent helicase/nuclease subunit B